VGDRLTLEFRRSERVRMTIPIEVCGTRENGLARETTTTLIVNVHGALIRVAIPLVPGQGVSVTNLETLKEISGEVVSIGPIADGKRRVAIRFTQRSPDFWGISSPPEDWNATEQKQPPKK
jgi:hypothetical protein